MISADPDWAAKFHLDALLFHLHGVDAHVPLAVRNVGDREWRARKPASDWFPADFG